MSTFHSDRSPSGASRWMRCPGSLAFKDEDETNDIALEGTILHAVCEDALRTGEDAFAYVGEEWTYQGKTVLITEELAQWIQDGLDMIDSYEGQLFIEKRVHLDRWMPGDSGTLDVGIKCRKLNVIWDWKWGYLPVSPVENYQLMLYALGFYEAYLRGTGAPKKFRLIIFQPRSGNGGGEWDIHLDDLLDFGEKARKAAKLTKQKDAPRVPGRQQCTYCAGAKKGTCREYNDWIMRQMLADFEQADREAELGQPLTTPPLEELTPERAAFIVRNRPVINAFLDRLEAQVLDRALKGEATPGLKAGMGRKGARAWSDELLVMRDVTKALGLEKAFTKKLITPRQFETLVAPEVYKRLVPFIRQTKPKPILVDDKDSRPSVPTIKELLQGE